MRNLVLPLFLLLGASSYAQEKRAFPTIGEVIRLDPALDALIPPDAEIEVLASGFDWSEGPVWVKHADEAAGGGTGGYLLFSDIPPNRVMKWEENVGLEIFLEPAGYTGFGKYGGEPGSNGLALDKDGRLISCEHGNRRLSAMHLAGDGKRTVTDNWEGKRFNSPNDLAIHSSGAIYFTDPIYGLPEREKDSRREIDFCGVYRLGTDGVVTLLTQEFERPNGIAFSPDEKILYVAQSHGPEAVIKRFPVGEDGGVGESSVVIDLTGHMGKLPGAPDGLKVDAAGNLFATGPGGCWVITPEGKALGRISTGERMANCGWGEADGATLYLTSDMYLCRIQTTTKGAGW